MKNLKRSFACAAVAVVAVAGFALPRHIDAEYRVTNTAKVGGDGGWDYVYADSVGRKLYIPRTGPNPRITIFDLDTLAPAGEIPKTNARGAAVDSKSHHGFSSSKPVAMWDTESMKLIKTIDVDGRPDGILADDFDEHVYIFSHSAPNVTVIDGKDGKVLGTIDLGGQPEQAASDGAGHIYVDLEDKDSVAVIDSATMKVTNKFELSGKGGGPGGLALDSKNHVLFVACHEPQTMVMLDSRDGKFLASLPIGNGVDGAGFNPDTLEAFSSQGDGTVTIIKEKSPTEFVVEQTVKTQPGARTMTVDAKTGKVFTIVAQFGPAPEPPAPAGQRPRRGPMIPGSFSIITVGK